MQLEDTIRSYLRKRPYAGPFPDESVAAWAWLLDLQRVHGQRGDVLEIGVQYGTSAFMLIEHLGPEDRCWLYDLVCEQRFSEALSQGWPETAPRVVFTCADTLEADPGAFRARHPALRWIHIDGGHLYRHVWNDLCLTAPCLGELGLLVLDDVFEVRWPDATRAAFDWLAANPAVTPLLFVGRKLYCCRAADVAVLRERIRAHLPELERIASVRAWDTIEFFGNPGFITIKLEPLASVFGGSGKARRVSQAPH